MQIFVKANKTYIIEENDNISVNELKKSIQQKLDLKTNNYYLVANAKILENNKNISEYKIDNFTTIYVNFRPHNILNECVLQFFVKLDKSYTVIMSKYDKLSDLKDYINKKFNFKNSKYYYLIFNGKILKDNAKSLQDYDLEKDCNIFISIRHNDLMI